MAQAPYSFFFVRPASRLMLFTVALDTPHSVATAPTVLSPACRALMICSRSSGVSVARFRFSAFG